MAKHEVAVGDVDRERVAGAEVPALERVLALLSEVGGSLVDTTAKANFRALGKRFGKRVQDVAKAVANADAAALSLPWSSMSRMMGSRSRAKR